MRTRQRALAFRVSTAIPAVMFVCWLRPGLAQPVAHVFHLSVDGLRPDAITALGPTNLPNFYRLRTQGSFTDNARTDFDDTTTLVNHASQFTGRVFAGELGHNWLSDYDPAPGVTLASNKGAYVPGLFEVAHAHGLRTGLYASKTKFSLFVSSWNSTNAIPPDRPGTNIDVFTYTNDTAALVTALVTDATAQPFGYVFLHLVDLDSTGHLYSWDVTPGSAYSEEVRQMDSLLGSIFDLIDHDSQYSGSTAIVLTADHGGTGFTHVDPTLVEDYTIPFYVWGPGVVPGTDLYALNPLHRSNPGTNRPPFTDVVQPIRNGETANVALQLLGLPPVPGSTLNRNQELNFSIIPPADFRLVVNGPQANLSFTPAANAFHDVEWTADLASGTWQPVLTSLFGDGIRGINLVLDVPASAQRFYRLQVRR